jgi:hypothetical protein
MQFRVATLNLEQDHKRWDARRDLINAEIGRLKPDLMAFNEVCIPLQSARGLRYAATALTGIEYNLVQQTRVNGLSKVEGEALLTRFGIVETGNFDYQTKDIVALVAHVANDCGTDVGFEFLDLLAVDPLGGVAPGSQLFDICPLIGPAGFEFPFETTAAMPPGRGAELVCALVQAKLMPDVPPPMRVARGCGRDICCGSASRSCVEECKAGAPERSAKESAAPRARQPVQLAPAWTRQDR